MSNEFPFNHFINLKKPNNIKDINEINNVNLDKHFGDKPQLDDNNSDFSQDELNIISEEINKSLKESISPQKYSAYFNNTFNLIEIKKGTVVFSVANSFAKKMIENNYLDQIKQNVFNLLNTEYSVDFVLMNSHGRNQDLVAQSNAAQGEISQQKSSSSAPSFKIKDDNLATSKEINEEVESTLIKYNNNLDTKSRFDKSKKFSNFVVGPSNNMAFAFSHAVAKDPGKVYPQLYIFGNSGLGKTHILHALCNEINETKPHHRICFTNANEFMSEMVFAIQSNKIAEFRRKYTELVDILIIDDIHELKNKSRTQSEFFYIFNELQSKKKQLVFTSDKQPKDINGIEDRIRTRLSSALLIDIQQPDLETRIAILKKKAIEKDIYLDDEVINLIASCVKTNVRELEGNLVKLGAYSDLMNVDIDLEIAKKQLRLCEGDDQKVLNIESITKMVASYFKLSIGDIKGKTRKKEIALARHIAMYMSHKILKKTLEEIGEFFENRDHSTVIHGIKKIQNLIKEDSKISQYIYEIESRL